MLAASLGFFNEFVGYSNCFYSIQEFLMYNSDWKCIVITLASECLCIFVFLFYPRCIFRPLLLFAVNAALKMTYFY